MEFILNTDTVFVCLQFLNYIKCADLTGETKTRDIYFVLQFIKSIFQIICLSICSNFNMVMLSTG
jgi:hypothetical protein